MNEYLKLMLNSSIKHICNKQVTCSGSECSKDDFIEIPSDIFIELTILWKNNNKDIVKRESYPPDWQYHFLTWCKLWNIDADFIDLGYLHYTKFPEHTYKYTKRLLCKDDEGIVQTTIIKIKWL